MPAVVSDASPLIFLAVARQLHLLKALYGKISIPPAVWHEVALHDPALPGSDAIEAAVREGWIELAAHQESPIYGWLRSNLDEGETQAIMLALAQKAETLLMDESDGRQIAANLGLHPVGTLGVLLRAKRLGLVSDLAGIISELRQKHDFRISDEIVARILAAQ